MKRVKQRVKHIPVAGRKRAIKLSGAGILRKAEDPAAKDKAELIKEEEEDHIPVRGWIVICSAIILMLIGLYTSLKSAGSCISSLFADEKVISEPADEVKKAPVPRSTDGIIPGSCYHYGYKADADSPFKEEMLTSDSVLCIRDIRKGHVKFVKYFKTDGRWIPGNTITYGPVSEWPQSNISDFVEEEKRLNE